MADNIAGPISILFNAAALATAAFAPPFQVQIQGQDPTTAAASSLDIVDIDATLEEVHSYTSDVTEHPVETGADITDHVRPRPIELRLRGIVSNDSFTFNPTGQDLNAAESLGLSLVNPSIQSLLATADISAQAFATLTKLQQASAPCIVYTPYRTYDSMVMASLEIVRDQKTGDALGFTASFRQVTTVESASATVTLPAFAQAPLDTGAQGTTDAGAAVTARTQSIAVQMTPAFYSSMAAKVAAAGAAP